MLSASRPPPSRLAALASGMDMVMTASGADRFSGTKLRATYACAAGVLPASPTATPTRVRASWKPDWTAPPSMVIEPHSVRQPAMTAPNMPRSATRAITMPSTAYTMRKPNPLMTPIAVSDNARSCLIGSASTPGRKRST